MRCIDVDSPLPPDAGEANPLARLQHGSRLAVIERGGARFVELQISRIKASAPTMWSGLYRAEVENFDEVDGSWREVLTGLGAVVGTREQVLGDSGRRRRNLCVRLDGDVLLAPLVSYCLTRVIPLVRLDATFHEPRKALPNQRVVYVIELEPIPRDGDRTPVYVGETGRTPEARFKTHRSGGRTASGDVRRRGKHLRPDLYRHVPAVGDPDARRAQEKAPLVERWLKESLEQRGFSVYGGTRGLQEAPFVQGAMDEPRRVSPDSRDRKG